MSNETYGRIKKSTILSLSEKVYFVGSFIVFQRSFIDPRIVQYFYKYSFNQAKQTQHLTEMLTPELEKAMKKEERMVKELEQVEQEGKAYKQQLEGMKERFGGRLCQISGFLGLNTKK